MTMKCPAVVLPAAILQALVAPAMAPQGSLTTRYFPRYFVVLSVLVWPPPLLVSMPVVFRPCRHKHGTRKLP